MNNNKFTKILAIVSVFFVVVIYIFIKFNNIESEYILIEESKQKNELIKSDQNTDIESTDTELKTNGNNDEYKLVWQDEFEGDTLNLTDWNVEVFEPGANNEELEKYTSLEEGNIQVKDGELHIIPIYNHNNASEENSISERSFNNYSVDIPVSSDKLESDTIAIQLNFGKINDNNSELSDNIDAFSSIADITITNLELIDLTEGSNQTNMLSSGCFENTADWSMVISDPAKGYYDYSNGKLHLKIEYAGEENWQIQLQQFGLSILPGHTYQFTMEAASDIDRCIDVILIDPEKGYEEYGAEKLLINGSTDTVGYTCSNGEITSGRITTQGKHDYTYGRFEIKAKVPNGKGFLPAFWLLATNDPKCAEIDIMEVMGDETNKSYHTIHYGNTYTSGHMQSQMTHVLSDSNYEDYHIFRVDWEPGLIVWYVDNEEVYRTTEWYSGTEDNKLPYPAPFNQDFFIILNLAIGGNWVGYPDYEAIHDFEGKEFVIDYVRVYQKDESVYTAAEKYLQK